MNHVKNIAKCIIFLTILASSLLAINKTLEPKFILKNNTYPTTSTYRQFYNMDKYSIDVLFLGSSVGVNAFIPQEIYNTYGIRTYNLCSEQQSIYLSYYWLMEALRFQKPKVVVLDARFMWNSHPENPLNTTESSTRKCLDPMKWSSVKREAVHNLCMLDKSQSELSYYLTNIRFHSRWSGIQEYDINNDMVDKSELKGFGPITTNGPETFKTFDENDETATVEFVPLMQEYLDKTVQLCKENSIKLVLIDLPANTMNDGINNAHVAYAKKNGIDYYNLCSTANYNEIGAILPEENATGHQNIWGAIKTSQFIGKLLSEKYGLVPIKDRQYEITKASYDHTKKSAELLRIDNQSEYLQAINDKNFAIFFVAHGNSSSVLGSEEIINGMQKLGLNCLFINSTSNSYVAAIAEGIVIEEESSIDQINYVGSFRNKHSIFTLQSSGVNLIAASSIQIDGVQCSRKTSGLNIAIYDLRTNKVIDNVTFQGKRILR